MNQQKTAAYLSLIRSILEYCCTVLSSYTQDYINKLEMVQRRAARYVTNRYHNTSSVTSMLEHLEWESLESRRVKCQLTMLFKIINDLLDIPPDQYLREASTRTRSHYSHKCRHVPASSDYFKNSFYPKNHCSLEVPTSLFGRRSQFGIFQMGAQHHVILICLGPVECKLILVTSCAVLVGTSCALVPAR